METLEKDSALQSRLLKQKRLGLQVKIVGNATPASKTRSSDLPGVALIVAEGQETDAPAGVSYVAPDDATGKFSVILDKAALGGVEKVYSVQSKDVTGTNAVAFSVSAEYIVLDIDSSADLSAANCELKIVIDYLKK